MAPKKPHEDIKWLKKAQADHEPLNLLIDFGNVVVNRIIRTPLGGMYEIPRDKYHTCSPVPGAMHRVAWLVEALGRSHVYMCKGLPNVYTPELKNLIVSQLWRWVELNRFLEITKVDPNRVLFKTRVEKVGVCLEKEGNWIVLDDRAEILGSILPLQEVYGDRLQFVAVNPILDEWMKYIPTEEFLQYRVLKEAPTFAETPKEWWEAILRLRRRQVKLSQTSKGEFY